MAARCRHSPEVRLNAACDTCAQIDCGNPGVVPDRAGPGWGLPAWNARAGAAGIWRGNRAGGAMGIGGVADPVLLTPQVWPEMTTKSGYQPPLPPAIFVIKGILRDAPQIIGCKVKFASCAIASLL